MDPVSISCPVLRNSGGRRLTVDLAEKMFRTIRETAEFPHMHLHDCSHVALTRYARLLGVALADVMAFGGHRSTAVALRYRHTDDERTRALASKVEAPRWVRS